MNIEQIGLFIDQAKQDIQWQDKIGKDSYIEEILDELQNRSSMLFAKTFPQLASAREYKTWVYYVMAFDLIYIRARQELGMECASNILTPPEATREEFAAALLEWAERYR